MNLRYRSCGNREENVEYEILCEKMNGHGSKVSDGLVIKNPRYRTQDRAREWALFEDEIFIKHSSKREKSSLK